MKKHSPKKLENLIVRFLVISLSDFPPFILDKCIDFQNKREEHVLTRNSRVTFRKKLTTLSEKLMFQIYCFPIHTENFLRKPEWENPYDGKVNDGFDFHLDENEDDRVGIMGENIQIGNDRNKRGMYGCFLKTFTTNKNKKKLYQCHSIGIEKDYCVAYLPHGDLAKFSRHCPFTDLILSKGWSSNQFFSHELIKCPYI